MGSVADVVRERRQAGQGSLHATARFAHAAFQAQTRFAGLEQLCLEPAVVVRKTAGPLEQAVDALLQRLQFFFHPVDVRDSPPQGQADGRAPGCDGRCGRIG